MLKCGEHHIVHQPTAQCVESIRDKGRGCRMLYLTAYRQHVSCVAVQRDAILGTCNTADLRGVPTCGR
jgi:hypothetical protein